MFGGSYIGTSMRLAFDPGSTACIHETSWTNYSFTIPLVVHPKNWRWFHQFAVVIPLLSHFSPLALWRSLPFLPIPSHADARRNKRKRWLLSLASE